MNRYEELFGTIERATTTLLSMKCTNQDDFDDCEQCRFWMIGGKSAPCPQYPNGVNKTSICLYHWLKGEM